MAQKTRSRGSLVPEQWLILDQIIQYASPSFKDRLGISPEELVGLPSFARIHPEDLPGLIKTIDEAILEGTIAYAEFRYQHIFGQFIWVEAVANSIFDENHNPIGAVVVMRDVSKRKEAEIKLQFSEERFLKIFKLNPIPLGIASLIDGRFVDVNDALIEFMEFNRQEIVGRKLEEIQPFSDGFVSSLIKANVHNEVTMKDMEITFRTKLGKLRIGLLSTEIIEISGIRFVLGSIQDITERKNFEEKLVIFNQKTNDILESITDAFFALDNQCRITYINKTARNFFYQTEQCLGHNFWDVFPDAVNSVFYMNYNKVINEKIPTHFETVGIYVGKKKWVEVHVYPSQDGIAVYFRDITERKEAEKRLLHYASIIENSNYAIISTDNKGIVTSWNPGAKKYFGYSSEEMIGQSVSILSTNEHDKFDDAIHRLNLGEHISQHDTYRKRKDGTFINVATTLSPLINAIGEIIGISSIHRDITEQKQIEKEIFRLDRLNLVGEMAAGIGHEVRNPMTTVRGFLQMMGEKEIYQNDKGFLELMIEELDRANSIITEFLSLAKNKNVERRRLNLNFIIETIFPLIKTNVILTENNINIELAEIPDLLLDEKEIRQLILNLVRNGLEAMPTGGLLRIKTLYDKDRNEVVLIVEDKGSGIPSSVIDQIGTPFISTKDNGTGLGLAICYSIAKRHNAKVKFDTGSNGTIFYVSFKDDLLKEHKAKEAKHSLV